MVIDGRVVRIGIAGLGEMGQLHLRNALEMDGVEVVAVAAARPGHAERVAAECAPGARATGYDELFAADDVDAVVLAARSIDHARHAISVLEHGKHLLLEKPGATTLADAERLRAVAEAHPDAVAQVAYNRRFDTAFGEARRRIQEGAIGRPLMALMTSRDMEWPEGENPRDTGGFLLDMAAHDYDMACWLLGQEPVEVDAARQALVHPELGEVDDCDNALVRIRFDGGALATTHVSRTCAYGHDVRCEVVGTDGSVFVGNGAGGPGTTVVGRDRRDEFPGDFRARFEDGYRGELAAFVAACRGEETEIPGLADDRRAVAIGVAARASAVAGRPLAVGEDWPWNGGFTEA
ncbi:MAG TPA: Gfo/Idh/MocA family oxidoreductase [Baekduia sp.]|nr:Gfo/Idh/MocA family oxidoreductase [Baekduia sp.]